MKLMNVDNLGFRYGDPWVLRHLDFTIAGKEFIGVLGPNGSGKSTLLRLLDGLLTPQEGRVLLDGIPVHTLKRREVARRIAVVPQHYSGIFAFSAREIVLMGRSPHLRNWSFEEERDYAVVQRVMEQTDTLDLAARPLDQLSGGERQRVLIARALAQEPQLLLLDEPTAFLDIRHQVEILSLLKTCNRNEGLTVVAVTHDINLASLYCDRIILLDRGVMHDDGLPEAVLTAENIEAVYGTPVLTIRHELTGRPVVAPRTELW